MNRDVVQMPLIQTLLERQRQVDLCEVFLVYIASSRPYVANETLKKIKLKSYFQLK